MNKYKVVSEMDSYFQNHKNNDAAVAGEFIAKRFYAGDEGWKDVQKNHPGNLTGAFNAYKKLLEKHNLVDDFINHEDTINQEIIKEYLTEAKTSNKNQFINEQALETGKRKMARSFDDLQKTQRGRLAAMGRISMGIAKKDGDAGAGIAAPKKGEPDKRETILAGYTKSALGGVLYKMDAEPGADAKKKTKGIIFTIGQDAIDKIKPTADAAIADINALKYTDATKKFINAYFGLKGPAGERGMATNKLNFKSV